MKVFMTGATGFIGSSIARKLRARGDELIALVRDPSKAGELESLGVSLVRGDLSDEAAIRSGMEGVDAVIHGAAIYEVGIPKKRREALAEANIGGTERVLTAALEAGVPRVVYISTCAIFGNTRGQVADEEYRRPDLGFTSYYEETKYRAHQVALDLIAKRDLPCVIVQPNGVYGPNDHSAIANTIEQFLAGKQPLLPFPEFGSGMTHVDDVAEGVLLALDKGEVGQSYIINAANTTMKEIVGTVAELTGRKPPRGALPTPLLKAMTPFGPLVGKVMGQPPNLRELISSADGVTFWADDSKAERELGFRPRGLKEGLRDTLVAEGRLSPTA